MQRAIYSKGMKNGDADALRRQTVISSMYYVKQISVEITSCKNGNTLKAK